MTATQPSSLSAPGLYLSNWTDLIAIWLASSGAPTDVGTSGPRLGELHLLDGPASARGVNQIVDSTGFFRDETRGVSYVDAHPFRTEAWFQTDPAHAGILTSRYVAYAGRALDLDIRRDYAAVPQKAFLVIQYTITNNASQTVVFNVLDQVHVANVAGSDPGRQVHASYDSARHALIADMTASGQFFVVLGAFDGAAGFDTYQVGDDTDMSPASPTASGWCRFNADGTLPNNADLRANDVDLAFQKKLTIAPGATESVAFYLSVRATQNDALAASDEARAQSASAWLAATATSYAAWFENAGPTSAVAFADDGINQAFRQCLVIIKNAQNPILGTMPAATNPYAYKHKAWVRDASVSAIALDASGHTDEAELYWRWMAGVQGSDGSWKTTFSAWDGSYLAFVEPEDDSVGTFLYGVCRHYELTGDVTFLRDIWPAVQRAADFVLTNLQSNGFGPADYSIWEEGDRGLEHNTYTQTWYVLGFYATQRLAEVRGQTDLADWYAGGPGSIVTAFQRPDDAYPPGMWNSAGGYFNRAVSFDNQVHDLIDSSSNVIAALGAVDFASNRARSHVAKVTSTLTCSNWGLSRYLQDDYYYDDPYDPAGDEVGALSPAWPQMSMWVAIYENVTGSPNALSRLQWFVGTMGAGYTPQGEAVSNVTGVSVLSSMCEPLTASSFVLAALSLQGKFVLEFAPPIYNAGARKALAVQFGTVGDWLQWANVPYFVPAPPTSTAATAQTTMRRVYLANDGAFIYLRIDNVAGALAQYGAAPVFGVRVYSGDFAQGSGGTSSVAADGGVLARPANFMVERRSDSDAYNAYRVVAARWTASGVVQGAIAPQWDPALGRIEVVIPMAAFASGPLAASSWSHLIVALAILAPGGSLAEVHRAVFQYRVSAPDQPWIYGNIEM